MMDLRVEYQAEIPPGPEVHIHEILRSLDRFPEYSKKIPEVGSL
jgi:hypothetical protein